MNVIKVLLTASCLLSVIVVSTGVEASETSNAPDGSKKGCRIVAGGAIEVQIFDDIGNGDEGDIIDAFKMKAGDRSVILTPENKRGIVWYKFRYLNGQRWHSKFRVYCKVGGEILVP